MRQAADVFRRPKPLRTGHYIRRTNNNLVLVGQTLKLKEVLAV